MTPEQISVVRGHCHDCDWEFERPLDAASLSAEENQQIAARVIRSHAFKCRATSDDCVEIADVELDMTGGLE